MKKILLLLTSAITLIGIAGCAEEENPAPAFELSYEEKIRSTNVNDITEEEAIYLTIQSLYNMPELSANVKENIIKLYEGLQDGSIFTLNEKETAGETIAGIGEVKYSAIASAVVQSLYKEVKSSNAASLKHLLTYDTLDNKTLFDEAIVEVTQNVEDQKFILDFINNFANYVIASQDNIIKIADEYTPLLLDSSSSASKTAGGGGVVSTQEYYISANIVYMLSYIAENNQIALGFDAEKYPEKIKFLASTIYGINDATKLKITYDKSLVYFNMEDTIEGINTPEVSSLIHSILMDINTTEQIPGGAPYPATYVVKAVDGVIPQVPQDAKAATNPFYDSSLGGGYITADILIYTTIGNYLLASPTGNSIYAGSDYSQLVPTNMVNNNMLIIYQKLKENGLKAPLYTGAIGAKSLSTVIAKHLTDNGIVYLNSNVDTQSNEAAQKELNNLITAMFKSTNGVEAPACKLIKEYNKTIDESAIGRPSNQGFYTRDASGGLCNIYIDDALRKNFDEADYK